jgi:hypothetical protein
MWLRRQVKVTAVDAEAHVVTLVAEIPAPTVDAEGRPLPRPYAGPRVTVVLDYGKEVAPPANDGLNVGHGAVLDLRTL